MVRMGKIKWSEEVTNEQVMDEMMEVKGVGRRRTQLLDYLINRMRYW